jgi:hypothetical protein
MATWAGWEISDVIRQAINLLVDWQDQRRADAQAGGAEVPVPVVESQLLPGVLFSQDLSGVLPWKGPVICAHANTNATNGFG